MLRSEAAVDGVIRLSTVTGIHDGLWPVGIRPSIQADTSESQDILELAQSAFVASEVYGELIILVGVPESVVWEVV